jgi:hypothetical protein
MGFEWNNDGLEKLQRQLQEQFSGGVDIPLDGSEDEAIWSVINQLQGKGLTTNDAEIAKWVRDHRAANQAGH